MRRAGGDDGVRGEAAADLARRVALLAVLALAASCAQAPVAAPTAAAPTPRTETLQLGGRSVRLFDPGHARALVIALHGSGGSGAQFERDTGFDAEATRSHFRVLYPDGTDRNWNAGFCCPFGSPPAVDDVAFLSSLIDGESEPGWKVFVTGFSNGGMMAYRLACQVPQRVTAIGVVGADSEECAPRPPLPAIVHLQGTADQLTGNRVWALRAGRWVNTEPSATARWQRLGAEVKLVSVSGGSHTWYHQDPDATRTIGDFFAARA